MEFPTEPEIEAAQDSWRNVRVILRHFRKDIRKRRGVLAGGAFFGFIYAAARVAEPWPLKVVFDQVLFGKPARGLIGTLFTPFGHSPYDILGAAGLALGVTGLIRAVAYYYEDFLLLRDVVVDAIVSLGTGLLLIVMMVMVMALVDPVLTGVSLLVMPVIFA